MKIGLDLSVIQTPHRMRGIGATAINFVNSMPEKIKNENTFVLFLYKEGLDAALAILNLDGIDYEIRSLKPFQKTELKLPGRFRIVNSIFNRARKVYESRTGDQRPGDISELDAYLCFDQMQTLPKKSGHTKRAVVIYDLIPYVMEDLYLWSYSTARKHGDSRKAALRKSLLRKIYIKQLKTTARQADSLLAISEFTKNDFVRYTGVDPAKVSVVPLGVSPLDSAKIASNVTFERFVDNSWGSFPKNISLDDKPFLLFVGGADPRRKLIDLIAAYNNLRAQGHDIRLALAGDSMKSPKSLPSIELQKYLIKGSYLDDIIFLGFVTDEQREWLYDHALAMVYPSLYEGFGLPVLEAMRYGTPVITYDNSSISEIAGDAALYANDSLSIKSAVEQLLHDSSLRKHYREAGKAQAAKFAWSQTVTRMVKQLLS